MPIIEFVPVTDDHVEWVATHMRPADRAECAAAGATDMRKALDTCRRTSILCWTATVDGEPAFICGVAPLRSMLDHTGVPWLLGTPLAPRHARALMRHFPTYIAQMRNVFSHLLNFVHADNKVAIGWLKHMGFTVHDTPLAVPPHGALFHQFEMHADV